MSIQPTTYLNPSLNSPDLFHYAVPSNHSSVCPLDLDFISEKYNHTPISFDQLNNRLMDTIWDRQAAVSYVMSDRDSKEYLFSLIEHKNDPQVATAASNAITLLGDPALHLEKPTRGNWCIPYLNSKEISIQRVGYPYECYSHKQDLIIREVYLLPDERHILLTDLERVDIWQLFDENETFNPIRIQKPIKEFLTQNGTKDPHLLNDNRFRPVNPTSDLSEHQISLIQDKSVRLDVSPPFELNGTIRIQNASFKIKELVTTDIRVENLKQKILSIPSDEERKAYFLKKFHAAVQRGTDGYKVQLAQNRLDHKPGSIWPLDIHFIDGLKLKRGPFLRWPADINSIDVSPDGKWIFFGGSHAGLLDLQTCVQRFDFSGHYGMMCAAFSPDSKWLLLCNEPNKIQIYNLETGENGSILTDDQGCIERVGFSPDGNRFFSSAQGNIKIWDFQSGKELLRLKTDIHHPNPVVFSSDSKSLLTGHDYNIIQVWNCDTNKNRTRINFRLGKVKLCIKDGYNKHSDIRDLVVSPCGKYALSASLTGVWYWDLISSELIHRLEGKEGISDFRRSLYCVSFFSDSKRAISSAGQVIKIWDLPSSKELFRLEQKLDIRDLRLLPDGKHILIANRDLIQKWQLFDENNVFNPVLVEQNLPVFSPIDFNIEDGNKPSNSNREILSQQGARDLLLLNESSLKPQKPNNNATYESKDVYIDPNKQTSPTQISQPTHNSVVSPTAATQFFNEEVTKKIAQVFIDMDANALKSAVGKERHVLQAEEAMRTIFADPKLSDYYYVFMTQWTDMWLACKTIHGGMVANSQKNSIDSIPEFFDKAAEYLSIPGAALIKDILSSGIKFWSDREKQLGVNRMANYFGTILKADEFIETLARELTLAQKTTIRALDAPKAGILRKMARSVIDLKNKITANDIDTKIKERAIDDGKKIIQAIMEGKLKPRPFLIEIPSILKDILGITIPPMPSISTTVTSQISIHQQSFITSPNSEHELKDTVEQLKIDAQTHKDEAEALRKKIESLEKSKPQPATHLKFEQALKKIEKIESIFDSAQILLPAPGQDVDSLTKQVVAQDHQITLMTQELRMLKEALGLTSPSQTETPAEKEKNAKIRAELLNKD